MGCTGSIIRKIKSAAVTAQADDFISSTPEGYQTMVAERGMSLSGGQKQRLSIVRAIVKEAEILIFDDSTSALDLKTEANLYDALQQTHPGITKIIVAQRIASVRRADRIVVLDKGRIAASGTHEELLSSCSVYQDFYLAGDKASGGLQRCADVSCHAKHDAHLAASTPRRT